MIKTLLPPNSDAPDLAATWARGMAVAEWPQYADAAATLARDLVSQALPTEPPAAGAHIQLSVGITDEGSLRVEVNTPPGIRRHRSGMEWASVYEVTRSFGTTSSPEGHLAWAEVREVAA